MNIESDGGDKCHPSILPATRSGGGEIGLNKAIVLVNRINLFGGLNWQAIPQALTAETSLVF